jgi:ribulose-phosphate 3-epimerase
MQYKVIPSIIAKNQEELNLRLNKIKFSRTIHLDVMDGKFVKNKSLMFDFKLPKNKNYEAHLMLKNPLTWIKKHKSKISTIIIHHEIKNLLPTIKTIKKYRKKLGLAINPETKINEIKNINNLDRMLVMTVHPGKYGSKFIPNTKEKIKQLRKLYPNLNIEVDGALNPVRIKSLKKLGANLFVSGSYIQNSKNPKKAFQNLKNSLKC